MIQFILNEQLVTTDLPPEKVLLDFIRYHRHLPGTKIGCREGDCGACTVLVGELHNDEMHYRSMTSCLLPLGNISGKHIVTVEGTNFPHQLNVVQQAMSDCGATQCGFCTPGFVVSLAGFCLSGISPTKENAIAAIDGNICRCTGYKSIERAAEIVVKQLREEVASDPVTFATQKKLLPEYFSGIKERLAKIKRPPLPIAYSPFTYLGGGTDLYVQKHDELQNENIRFLYDDPGLKSIRQEDNDCIMGPSVTVTDLMNSPVIREAFPEFHRYAKLVSSTPIRNMATVAGNFVNASPIGDLTIFFLALDTTLTLATSPLSTPWTGDGHARHSFNEGGGAGRAVPLRQFYKGYKQLDKTPEEYIESISFKLPDKNTFFNFEKVSKRTHLDIASVNTAICLRLNGEVIESAGLSAGGVGPVPMYLSRTSEYLNGKKITDATIEEAIAIMKTEISPISDARGSKEYKTLLLGQLVKAHSIVFMNQGITN